MRSGNRRNRFVLDFADPESESESEQPETPESDEQVSVGSSSPKTQMIETMKKTPAKNINFLFENIFFQSLLIGCDPHGK